MSDRRAPGVETLNRAFLIVLGPAAIVAIGYVFVLRAMGLEPPYGKLAVLVVMLGLGFWWIGKQGRQGQK